MLQSVIAFVSAHSAVLAALGIALLDFLVELVPALKGNNLIGLLLGMLSKAPPAPPAV